MDASAAAAVILVVSLTLGQMEVWSPWSASIANGFEVVSIEADEGAQVMETFSRHLGVKVIHVDASEQFMSKLAGVTDPEQKRKIIGREFVEVFQQEAGKLTNAKWLAQ